MGIAHFQKRSRIKMDGSTYELKRLLKDDLWQMEDILTGRYVEIAQKKLLMLLEKQELAFVNADENPNPLPQKTTHASNINATSQVWEMAKVRRALVQSIDGLPMTRKILDQAILNTWNAMSMSGPAPCWSTVIRWHKRFNQKGKDIQGLLPQHQYKGNRTHRYSTDVIHICEEVIDRVYLKRERTTVSETHEHAVIAIDRANALLPESMHLKRPTRRLIQSLINNLDAFTVHAARYGHTAATTKFRAKLRNESAERPLDWAEIDHTRLDLFVIDPTSGMPLGRPWMTICIDVYTRCILGIYIGFEPPSYLTVAKCLKHAFLPKASLKEKYPDIEDEWFAHGVMKRIRVDNGLEFHSEAFEHVCYRFDIDIAYMPRRQGWHKGKVERSIGTFNRNLCHSIKGTTFSNIFDKDDYDPAKHAVLDLETLNLIAHKWVVDYYHRKPHAGLDRQSPKAFWQSAIQSSEIAYPVNPELIDILMAKSTNRTLTHKGIVVHNILYNHPDLVALRKRMGSTLDVEVRHDELDLGRVWVRISNTDDFIEVPAINQAYASGLSLWQHDLCRKFAKENHLAEDISAYARAKVEIREIVAAAHKGPKSKTNIKVARFQEAQARTKGSMQMAAQQPNATEYEPLPDLQVSDPATLTFDAIIENRNPA